MEGVTTFFFNQGILGIIIIVLGGVILWEENEKGKLRSEIKELQKEVIILADKRVEDVRALLNTNLAAMDSFKNVQAQTNDGLKGLLQNVLSIVQNVQSLTQSKRRS